MLMAACGGGGGGGGDSSDGEVQPFGQYTLGVTVIGSGSVTLNPPGGVYDANTEVTLTATPQTTGGDGWDYTFSGWGGDLRGSSPTTSITMDADKSIMASFSPAHRLLVKGHDYDYNGGHNDITGIVWMTTSVRNAAGDFVADLDVDDFQLTEQIVAKADNSVKAEAPIDLASFDAGDNPLLGLAKTIFGHQPLDIVILLDNTGTMFDFYPGLKSELAALVDEMIANHVDFRMACRRFDSGVGGDAYFNFFGPQEVDDLLQGIGALATAGEWWMPTAAYDALLFTPWLGFRENARKVCVVITDVVPRTVYGAYWYGVETATRSAVERFLQNSGIELFYAQRDWEHDELHRYYDEKINPRAGDAASGFVALKNVAGNPLATRLTFPFDREEIKTALGLDTVQAVVDTEYVLSWKTSFDRWNTVEDSALIYHPEDYEMRVVLKVPDPDHAGEFLQTSCTYPIQKDKVGIVINAVSEEGTQPIDLNYTLRMKMGGRDLQTSWGSVLPSGQVNVSIPPGTYNLNLVDSSYSTYTYQSLRAILRDTITVDEDGAVFDVTVPMSDQEAELNRTRGLLKDIADWRLPGDPFQDMAEEANAWLDDMLSDGLSCEEMTAIKRFQVALAGFANVIEYSQLEAQNAIQDFDTIVQNFRDIVAEVDKIGNDTDEDWAAEIASGAIEILMVLMGEVQFTMEKEALEAAIDKLIDYAADEITQELRTKIIERLPLGEYTPLLENIVNTLIDADFGGDAFPPEWDAVISAVRTIYLDDAIAQVQSRISSSVAEGIVGATLENLPFTDSLAEEAKTEICTLIDTILKALISGDISGDTFSTALEAFASNLADDVVSTGPTIIAAAVNSAFNAVGDAMNNAGMDADVSGLLVGMARDLTLQAIPQNNGGVPQFHVDTDAVVSVLIKYGVYYVILKDYCIDDIKAGLDQLLADAKNYVPVGEDRWDWVPAMGSDFDDYADRVEDLQTTAWDALRTQNAISEWAAQMQQLCNLLDAVSKPLDAVAAVYPDLQDTAENVHSFIAVLDGMQILANATSFGLKVDALDTFGNEAQPMHQTLFY